MALPVPREPQPLPANRSRALIVVWNSDATVEHFSSVIESDPALTAAVMRGANSALSAPLIRVASAREAVVRLGVDAVRKLISAAIVRSEFEGLSHSRLSINELWRHVLATALIAEAACAVPEQRGLAFTAGLLHDLGRLSLATQNPARYAQVVLAAAEGADVSEAERHHFGVTHLSAGARLSEAWGLPDAVTEAAGAHHDLAAGGSAGLVARARDLAWRLGYGDGVLVPFESEFEQDPGDTAVLHALGGPERLEARIQWYRDSCDLR